MTISDRINRCLLAAAMLLLLLAALCPFHALAAEGIDLSREVELSIQYRDGYTPLAGAGFRIYLVATVDEAGELTPTRDFERYFVNIRGKNDSAWRSQALLLESYVLRDQIQPVDSGQTNRDGFLRFPTGRKALTPGLYLVLGDRLSQNGYWYDPVPFFVELPGQNAEYNVWDYSVEATAKYTGGKIPDTSQTVQIRVQKKWDDTGHVSERPKEITVYLIRVSDGKKFGEAKLNESNRWTYTWKDLDNVRWTVAEADLDGYTVDLEQNGSYSFVLTNHYSPQNPQNPQKPGTPTTPGQSSNSGKPEYSGGVSRPSSSGGTSYSSGNPTLPKTGQLWWPVPVFLCAGVLLIIIGLLRRRGSMHV